MRLPNDVLRDAIQSLRASPGADDQDVNRLLVRLQAVDANLCADPECHRYCKVSCGKVAAS